MGPQGVGKGKKHENAWQIEKPYQIVDGIYEVPSKKLFLLGPRMESPGAAKGTKLENVWHVDKPYQVLLEFMKSH